MVLLHDFFYPFLISHPGRLRSCGAVKAKLYGGPGFYDPYLDHKNNSLGKIEFRQREIGDDQLANNKKKLFQVAVIGLGRFGANVAITLTELGCNVLAMDKDMDKVESIVDKVTHAVQVDGTSEEGLSKLGLSNFDIVVVAIGNSIQGSILATLIVKELGVKTVIAKVSSDLHGKALEKIGVSRIIFPEKDSGIKLAHSLMSINLVEYLEISPDYRIAEIIIQEKFDGKTLRDADLRNRYGLNVLAIRNGEKINISPQAEDLLKKGDMLVLLGSTSDLRRFDDNC